MQSFSPDKIPDWTPEQQMFHAFITLADKKTHEDWIPVLIEDMRRAVTAYRKQK